MLTVELIGISVYSSTDKDKCLQLEISVNSRADRDKC